ncbi:hypothetical protein JB92DRAFT_2984720 [Gautieria morchelliformis]|nr:hypothetical protein JB92DRAFT_2984720 [Gautieria morchelliformis]
MSVCSRLSRRLHVLISFLSEAPPPAEGSAPNNADEPPPKRSRGRPKGSKNKPREGAASSAPVVDGVKRKRGRPPKVGALLSVPFSFVFAHRLRGEARRDHRRRPGR